MKPIIPIPNDGTPEKAMYDLDNVLGLLLLHEGPSDGRTFSPEGINELASKFHLYLMAQVAKRWNEEKEPPTTLSVVVRLGWEDPDNADMIATIDLDEKIGGK
tara:strand:- start:49 stop:357 length:309 start_codon:yes stop_codon:yes gene_type:complete